MSSRYFPDDRRYKVMFYVLVGLIAAVALSILFGFVVRFLWNETIAAMFDVTTITFWQALGLFLLAKLFFGFGGGGGSRPSRHKKRWRRRPEDSGDDAPIEDEAFRQFWQAEGKAAYEAYREERHRTGDQVEDAP